MTITSAFSNALTGLTASARMAEIVSSNTANALTEGYARRELVLSPQSLGGNGAGVKINGVSRQINESTLQDRRLADAAAANAGIRTEFLDRFEALLGVSTDSDALTARVADLESALVEAASLPESEARLAAVVDSAEEVAQHLNAISKDIEEVRTKADHSIGDEVERLNTTLKQIDELNHEILVQKSSGNDATALQDQRQGLIDQVSAIVPVRQVTRENYQISLYTTGGAILLDDNPVEVGFTPVNIVTADMTQASGALSGLTIAGNPVSSSDSGVLGGGSLGALFAVRDELAPEAQAQIDGFARELVERFSSSTADSTLPPGLPGLFTDNGGAFDPADEVGLAGRIGVNTLVVPEAGGELWRLRDGLGAATPGPVSNATALQALVDTLSLSQSPASSSLSSAQRSVAGLASDMLSKASQARQSSEMIESYAVARQEAATELVLADGVDTDYEMQTLLKVEQAYAANAKVLQTLDQLLQQILEI